RRNPPRIDWLHRRREDDARARAGIRRAQCERRAGRAHEPHDRSVRRRNPSRRRHRRVQRPAGFRSVAAVADDCRCEAGLDGDAEGPARRPRDGVQAAHRIDIDVRARPAVTRYCGSCAPGVKNSVRPPKQVAVAVLPTVVRSPFTKSVNVAGELLGGVSEDARLTVIGAEAVMFTAAVVLGTGWFGVDAISNRKLPLPATMHCPVQTTQATPDVGTVTLIEPTLPVVPDIGIVVEPMKT